MEFKGTKGEWIMDCRKKAIENYPNFLPIIDQNDRVICLVNHTSGEMNVKEYVANAEVIRASPELLEALQYAVEVINSTQIKDSVGGQIFLKKAEAVIKKATE